jgi:hypothetical protein
MKSTENPCEKVRRYIAERIYILAEDDSKAKLFKKLVERLRKETRE